MEIDPGQRFRSPLPHASLAVELEEPGEQVVTPFGVERRTEQRERVPVAALRERGEMGTQRALVVL